MNALSGRAAPRRTSLAAVGSLTPRPPPPSFIANWALAFGLAFTGDDDAAATHEAIKEHFYFDSWLL